MGPTWVLLAPGGPHVGPITLLSWVISHEHQDILIQLSISLLRLTSKETSKPAALALCEWNPLVTGGFPSQRASNAGSGSMSLYHNALLLQYVMKWVKTDGFSEHATYPIVQFKSDPLAAFTFRCARNVKAARGSDLNRTTYPMDYDLHFVVFNCG